MSSDDGSAWVLDRLSMSISSTFWNSLSLQSRTLREKEKRTRSPTLKDSILSIASFFSSNKWNVGQRLVVSSTSILTLRFLHSVSYTHLRAHETDS